jgi:two-component system response regulator AtoC
MRQGIKKGLFEEADGGTILLDEIGELPVHLQVKLLRVLQEQVIRPIGSAESISVDVRVLAATLRNLELDVEEGKFRDDLYYRLNVIPLTVPSLRERPEDIAVLTQHFLLKHRAKLGLPVYSLSDDALTLLIQYPWPGNIRELENTLERAMILCDGATIVASNLPERIRNFASDVQPSNSLIDSDPDNISIKSQTRHLEISLIKKALEQTSGNRTHAAKLLEISHRTLLYKLKEYGLADDV